MQDSGDDVRGTAFDVANDSSGGSGTGKLAEPIAESFKEFWKWQGRIKGLTVGDDFGELQLLATTGEAELFTENHCVTGAHGQQ
jgi:hypothetical protein